MLTVLAYLAPPEDIQYSHEVVCFFPKVKKGRLNSSFGFQDRTLSDTIFKLLDTQEDVEISKAKKKKKKN